jgi:hypothetical protein
VIPFPEQSCFNFVLEMEGVAKGDPGEAVSVQAPWATSMERGITSCCNVKLEIA